MQELLVRNMHLLACPRCRGRLRADEAGAGCIMCSTCRATYTTEDDIPLLFHPHDPASREDVTEIVKQFYEENPFPNYDDYDSSESLREKASRAVFPRLLDEQMPEGALVLEVGCGTGQLSNFFGTRWNRRVFGSDLCLNSLRLANGFRRRCQIRNTCFLQMNLFRPAFQEQVFDVVICNGVLHHTADPAGGFESIARLVKPNGVVVLGLYNRIGRLTTDLRRFLFRLSGDRLTVLDGHMRNKTYNKARKRAWFMDQYKNPHESKHSYDEVLGWFERSGFEFLLSIPKTDPGSFRDDEELFAPHDKGTRATRFLTQLGILVRGGVDGALFVMIGRKLKENRPATPLAEVGPGTAFHT